MQTAFLFSYPVPWPSGKAKVCKTFTPQFKSGRHLQQETTGYGLSFFAGGGSFAFGKTSTAAGTERERNP